MFFTVLDLILILIIFIFIAFGYVMGLIEAVGSLVGLVAGVLIGGVFYKEAGDWLSQFLFHRQNISYVIAFALIFIIVSKLTGLLFFIVNKIYKIFTLIPFLKTINRFAGAALGLIESVLVLGTLLLFISRFPFSTALNVSIAQSQLALWLMAIAKVLTPLLPRVIF